MTSCVISNSVWLEACWVLLRSVEPFIGSRLTAVWFKRFGLRDYRYLEMTPPTACPMLKTFHSEVFQHDPISRTCFGGRRCLRRPCTSPACVRNVLRFRWHFYASDTTAEPCSSLNECEVSGTVQLWRSRWPQWHACSKPCCVLYFRFVSAPGQLSQ
jgi:hypothetical protein